MTKRWDALGTGVLIVCALVTTTLLLRRELLGRQNVPIDSTDKAVLVAEWRTRLAEVGRRMGSESAPVQVYELGDFECPFCGSFYRSLKQVHDRYPEKIALTFVHFPIPGHRFALPAARVAECANDQERFEAMYDQLFEGQDQFGLKPWDDYATAAGVPDVGAFDACIKKTDPIQRVEEGKALGLKLDVKGTPTVIINGWKLGHPPSEAELDEMVKRILAGKQPVDAKT